MNEAQVNLITNIILETATLADFAAVSREYEDLVDFFSSSASKNGSAANVLLDWGKRVDVFSSSGIYIHPTDKLADYLNCPYRVFKEGFSESRYCVRFPDGHIEKIGV